MGKNRVLVKVNPDGKYVVGLSPKIDINQLTPATRVALRADSYVLHKILPSKVDPLVSLMRVEAVPDANYVRSHTEQHSSKQASERTAHSSESSSSLTRFLSFLLCCR